jgi:hypothetical protein
LHSAGTDIELSCEGGVQLLFVLCSNLGLVHSGSQDTRYGGTKINIFNPGYYITLPAVSLNVPCSALLAQTLP